MPEEAEPLAAAADAAAGNGATAAEGRQALGARGRAAGCGLAVAGALAAAALAARGGSLRRQAPAEEVVGLSSVIDEVSGAASAFGIMPPPVAAEGEQSMDLLAYAEELNRTAFSRQLKSAGRPHIGACVMRAIATASYLAFAGINVDSATKVCGNNGAIDQGHYAQLFCAASAQWAASSFAWAGYFLAGTIDACSGGTLEGADCAASSMELLAALLSTSAASTSAAVDCRDHEIMFRNLANTTARASALQLGGTGAPASLGGAWPITDGGGRRLQIIPNRNFGGVGGALNGAYCAFDIIFTIKWLAQAALSIVRLAVSRSCEREAEQAKLACAGLVLRTIASFAFTASYISGAVSDCGNLINMKAECASDISMAVGGASFAAAAGIGIQENCVPAKQEPLEQQSSEQQSSLSDQAFSMAQGLFR